jgi:hypothetical protein
MRTRRKEENRSDWRLAMEHIGRELRKLYRPVDVPPRLARSIHKGASSGEGECTETIEGAQARRRLIS